MTLEDMKEYEVSIRKPIDITYRGYKLYSTGVPSGGSVALSILKIIEGYDISSPSMLNLSTHRLDEAMRFSYAARAELGDPDFFSYMDDFEASMLNPETAEEIRGRILDDRTQEPKVYDPKGQFLPENHGTSHIVAADGSGMTVTLTSTVNLLFGSRLVIPETGVSQLPRHNYFLLNRSRSHNEQRNERLLHPRHLERIRLRPFPNKLHPPEEATAILHNAHHRRAPERNTLHLHRRSRRVPDHHIDGASAVARSRSQHDASTSSEGAADP